MGMQDGVSLDLLQCIVFVVFIFFFFFVVGFWKIYLDRPENGGCQLLVKYMQLFDIGSFLCWFRMFTAVFKGL